MMGFLIVCLIILFALDVVLFTRYNRLQERLKMLEKNSAGQTAAQMTTHRVTRKEDIQSESAEGTPSEPSTVLYQPSDKEMAKPKVYRPINRGNLKSNEQINEAVGSSTAVMSGEPALPKVKEGLNLFTTESIISKLGILLLLIGVGFIYKLAYDNGYITPFVAVLFGYLVGIATMSAAIWVVKRDRQILSQVLFGGGIAIMFIVTYGAYQGYGLIGSFIASVLLFAIAFAAFFIALSINSRTMSIIGLLGGLLTPFLVGTDYLGLYGTGSYIIFVSGASMAIYVFKKWRILQYAAIISVNLVILTLIDNSRFSVRESYEFSILILVIYLLFYLVEAVLFIIHDFSLNETMRSFFLLALLPFISLLQVYLILDLTMVQWAVVFTVIGIKFFVLNILVYRKKGVSVISNLTLSLMGGFLLMAVTLYFGGDSRYISSLILGLIYIAANKHFKQPLLRTIGLVMFSFGFVIGFAYLIDGYISQQLVLIDAGIYSLFLGLTLLGTFLESGKVRKILALLAIQLYATTVVMYFINDLTKYRHSLEVALLVFVGFIWIYYFLYSRFKLLYLLPIVIMSFLPVLFFGYSVFMTVVDHENNWWLSGVHILYGLSLFLLSYRLKELGKLVVIGRLIFYSILAVLLLVDIPVATEHFEYGLVLFGSMAYALKFLEKENRVMVVYRYIFWGGFALILAIYSMLSLFNSSFEWVKFSIDMVMLIILYLLLIEMQLDEKLMYVIHALLYLLVTYNNLQYGQSGLVTIFWAAYGILSLAYFVIKGKKTLANIALGLIVLVAGKLVVIDLSRVEPIWKIITSMAFGIGLLILSYIIQPILNEKE